MVEKNEQIKVIKNCEAITNSINEIEEKQRKPNPKTKRFKTIINMSDAVTGRIDLRDIKIEKIQKG